MHFCELRTVQCVPEDTSHFIFLIGTVVGRPRKLTFPNTKRENPRRTYPELAISFPSRDTLSLSTAPKASSSIRLFLHVCKCIKIIWKLIAPQKPCMLPTAAARERQHAGVEDVGLRMRPRVCTRVRWRRRAARRFTGCCGLPAPHNPPAHARTRKGAFRSVGRRRQLLQHPGGRGCAEQPALPGSAAASHSQRPRAGRRTQDSPPSLVRRDGLPIQPCYYVTTGSFWLVSGSGERL